MPCDVYVTRQYSAHNTAELHVCIHHQYLYEQLGTDIAGGL